MEAQGGGDDEQQIFDFEQSQGAKPRVPVNATPKLVSDTLLLGENKKSPFLTFVNFSTLVEKCLKYNLT